MLKLIKWVTVIFWLVLFNTAVAENLQTVTLPFEEHEITKDLGITFDYDLTSTKPNTNKIIICHIHNANQAFITWPHTHNATDANMSVVNHPPLILNEGTVVFINGETDIDVDTPAKIRHVDLKGNIVIHTTGAGDNITTIFNGNNIPLQVKMATACCHYAEVAT